MTSTPHASDSVVVLAGGTGGAMLADGFARTLQPEALKVVVNVGDDCEQHGLLVCPDLDAITYLMAGISDQERGWGIVDETWTVLDQLGKLGEETWFRLGDRDFATLILRTRLLRSGLRLTEVAAELARRHGLAASLLPVTDDPVRTELLVETPPTAEGGAPGEEWIEFQEYFVHRRQGPALRGLRLRGIESARPTPETLSAIASASTIVIAPSNPVVSIEPILQVAEVRDAILARRAAGVPVVAVSGIIGGRALKGPADRMLSALGEESSALGVARRYAGLANAFVLDRADAALEPAIAGLGMRTLVTDTIMTGADGRARLAREVLAWAQSLAAEAEGRA